MYNNVIIILKARHTISCLRAKVCRVLIEVEVKRKNSEKIYLGRGAIKKYGVAGRAKGSFRTDITARNSSWSILLHSLQCLISREESTFFWDSGTNVVHAAGQKDAFIKRQPFFLRLRPRIQFFLPLWCLRFCSVVSSLSPRPSFGRFVFEHPPRGSGGSFGLVFRKFIFYCRSYFFTS